MAKKRIGIVGYGNLGRGVELSIAQNNDMELIGIFTRRDPQEITTVTSDANVYSIKDIFTYKDKIDVLILCGGSATDLVNQGPEYAESFNTVDSFDNHAKIPDYFAEVDEAAKKAVICLLYLLDGIRGCFRSTDFSQNLSFQQGRLTHFGVMDSVRDIQTQ